MIELDVAGRRLHLDVSEAELDARRAAWVPPARKFERGFGAIYADHITQPDKGCDFDVLLGTRPPPAPHIHCVWEYHDATGCRQLGRAWCRERGCQYG